MSEERLNFIHHFEPAKEQDDKRVLLLLHATGGDETQMLPIARILAPGAAILSPRGKVLENGNPRFFRRLAEGVFDEEDLIYSTNELADFIKEACIEYQLDCDKIIAIGFSNGANIAASMLLLRPEILASAVLFRPQVPLIPEEKPDLSGENILISAGKTDPLVSVEETNRLYNLLRDSNANVTLYWDNSGHTITNSDIEAAKSWLGHYTLA